MSDNNPATPPTPVLEMLDRLLARAGLIMKNPKLHRGALALWIGAVRSQLEKLYGKGAAELNDFPQVPIDFAITDPHGELARRMEHVQRMIDALKALPLGTATPLLGKRVFIGHGRSPLWRELKDFLSDRLGLPWDEFNREPAAGYTTAERLETMMSRAAFAFLIMTAEEEHADATTHARPNVIHEVGLFQGRLGIRRAIVLVEEGCSEFSNIAGLSQIRFPRGDIASRFEEVRRTLEHQGLV